MPSPEPDESHWITHGKVGSKYALVCILSSLHFRSRKAFLASAVHANCSVLIAFHSSLTIVE